MGFRITRRLHGFSLAEILIVVTIIAILAILGWMAFQRQIARGYDSKRKTDLDKLRIAFDNYYNDKDCYPQEAQWNAYNCGDGSGGQFLAPYLDGQSIPCDPVTNDRYLYITIPRAVEDPPGAKCSGYRLFAALQDRSDIDIPGSGCDPDPNKGCGYEPYKYNYGISMGGVIANPDFDFTAPTPTSTPPTAPGDNFCLPDGTNTCNTMAGLETSDGTSCSDALRATGCVSFADGWSCNSYCQPATYETYKCAAINTTVICF